MRLLTKFKSLFPLIQYERSFLLQIKQYLWWNHICKAKKVSSLYKSRSRLWDLLHSLAKEHPCWVWTGALQSIPFKAFSSIATLLKNVWTLGTNRFAMSNKARAPRQGWEPFAMTDVHRLVPQSSVQCKSTYRRSCACGVIFPHTLLPQRMLAVPTILVPCIHPERWAHESLLTTLASKTSNMRLPQLSSHQHFFAATVFRLIIYFRNCSIRSWPMLKCANRNRLYLSLPRSGLAIHGRLQRWS